MRLTESRPTYNHQKWKEEAKANDDIKSNICEFKKPLRRGICLSRRRVTTSTSRYLEHCNYQDEDTNNYYDERDEYEDDDFE